VPIVPVTDTGEYPGVLPSNLAISQLDLISTNITGSCVNNGSGKIHEIIEY
jgi:hypothetical protein